VEYCKGILESNIRNQAMAENERVFQMTDLQEFIKRGGKVKIIPPRKAKGTAKFKKIACNHMGTKKTTHVYWDEETDESPKITATN